MPSKTRESLTAQLALSRKTTCASGWPVDAVANIGMRASPSPVEVVGEASPEPVLEEIGHGGARERSLVPDRDGERPLRVKVNAGHALHQWELVLANEVPIELGVE